MKSHHQIQKERPDFGGSILTPCRAIYNYVEYEEVVAKNVAEQLEDNRMKHERGDEIIVGHDVHYCAELVGGFECVLKMLLQKKDVLFNCVDNCNFVVLDSFDGAVHEITDKKVLNVTSYSSCLVSWFVNYKY